MKVQTPNDHTMTTEARWEAESKMEMTGGVGENLEATVEDN